MAPLSVEVKGRFLEDRLIIRTLRGELVRFKSEVIIADRLASHGIEYSYERELTLGGFIKIPDFTVEDDETGPVFYCEHCGMSHDQGYLARWQAKLQWYRRNIILPYEEGGGANGTLVVTRDSPQGGISSQDIGRVVTEMLFRCQPGSGL